VYPDQWGDQMRYPMTGSGSFLKTGSREGGGKMKQGKYIAWLVVVLVFMLAVPSISLAAPGRLTESFVMGDTGCQMNVQLDNDTLLNASVGPANVKPPACVWVYGDGSWVWSCPPSPCCVWAQEPGFNPGWYCADVCTACSTWDPANLAWSTPNTCPSNSGAGGGAPATCTDTSDPWPDVINRQVCSGTGCTEAPPGSGIYTCPSDNCEPLRFVERNIFEKSGDGSVYCYNSTAGKQVCKTCTTNTQTKVTTCVTK
jgi:hypothetical protein